MLLVLALTLYGWLCVTFSRDVSLPWCFLLSFMLLQGSVSTPLSPHTDPAFFPCLLSGRELIALLLWVVADRLGAVGLLCCTGTHTYNTCGGFPGPKEISLLLVDMPVCGIRTLDV